jgi:hypothetical protein
MTSLVNTAVTAVVASLQSGTPVCSQIARVRLRPVAQATALAVVVRPIQTQVAEAAMAPGYPVSWTTTIAIECYARAGSSTPPDIAVDALLEAVYARLMADPTLGGAVLALQPQDLSYDFDADSDQTTCATLVFNARQKTAGTTFN